jgi:hypothetical protein
LVITDPPYNVPVNGHVCGLGKVKHAEFAMAAGEMSEAEFEGFLTRMLQNLADFSVDGSIHFVCMDWRHIRELMGAGYSVYDELKNLIVWNKDNGGMGAFYRSKHELIFAFKKGRAPHINNFELGQHGRYRTNVDVTPFGVPRCETPRLQAAATSSMSQPAPSPKDIPGSRNRNDIGKNREL